LKIIKFKYYRINNETNFKYLHLIDIIEKDFKIDFYGDHGIYHWKNVYQNTKILK